jgi:cytochrome c
MRMRLLAAVAALTLTAAGAAHAAGDPVAGKGVFARCAACHVAVRNGGNGLGPNLFGVVGRKAGSLPNYSYSGALKGSGVVWTPDKLKIWVGGPQKLVPGTKMAFGGISNAHQIDDVVAYLQTLK